MYNFAEKQKTEVENFKLCNSKDNILTTVQQYCFRGMDKTESDNYLSTAMTEYSEIVKREFAESIMNELNPTDEMECEIINKIEELLKRKFMTIEEMKTIFTTEIPLNELVVDSGIYEFHDENGKGIGVSHETSEETGNLVYVFNIFLDDEYINISGEFESIYDAVEIVANEWNKW